jgi:hypothetical protein
VLCQDITLVKTDSWIIKCIRALHLMEDNKGKYEHFVPTNQKLTKPFYLFQTRDITKPSWFKALLITWTIKLCNDKKIIHRFGVTVKLFGLQAKITIPVTDFWNKRDLTSTQILQIIEEPRKIMKVIAGGSAVSERTWSLMNNIATGYWNALLIENISHVIMVKLLGKPIMDWDTLNHSSNYD